MYTKGLVDNLSKKHTVRQSTVRDKKLTKRLLEDAAAEIIKVQGIDNSGMNRIAEVAGRSRRMIYEYFVNMDGLLKTVIQKAAFKFGYGRTLDNILENNQEDYGKELFKEALREYFDHFKKNPILQEVTLKELNNPTELLKEIAVNREKYSERLFSLTTAFFEGSGVQSKFIISTLHSSIIFNVLYKKSTNSSFLGVDINSIEDQEGLNEHDELLIDLLYDHIGRIKAKL